MSFGRADIQIGWGFLCRVFASSGQLDFALNLMPYDNNHTHIFLNWLHGIVSYAFLYVAFPSYINYTNLLQSVNVSFVHVSPNNCEMQRVFHIEGT